MSDQIDLFTQTEEVFSHDGRTTKVLRFNGAGYIAERDNTRLTGQIERVYILMQDGEWRTLDEIAQLTGDPPASISAQLRHLRKDRFGGHTVERDYVSDGLYRYRLLVREVG
jgi:hypothetical protein